MFKIGQRYCQRLGCFSLLLILFNTSVFAQAYTFEHSDCSIRYKEQDDLKQSLEKKALELLKEKRFEPKKMLDNKRLLAGELYFTLEKYLPKEKLYTACLITVAIKKAEGSTPSKSDTALYKKTIKRRVPRITFKGSERCRKALEDAFIHIPYCKKIGYAGEKK